MVVVLLGLLSDTSWVEISLFSGLEISRAVIRTPQVYILEAQGDSLSVNGQARESFAVWGGQDKEIEILDGSVIRTYPGEISVVARGGRLRIRDKLRMEVYLACVVASEMGQAPLEALKAQAVLSRTLAFKRLLARRGYFADNESFQVYRGTGPLTDECLDAVRATSDRVLVYKGRLVEVFFHGACGGHTALPAMVWGGRNLPYLNFVVDSPCLKDTSQAWRASLGRDFLQKRFGSPDCPRILRRDSSGRVSLLEMAHVRIKGTLFRKRLGLRSTFISDITCTGDSVIITGRGYGHGIGVCQTGAALRASEGQDYEEILRFYYPGAEIVDFSSPGIGGR